MEWKGSAGLWIAVWELAADLALKEVPSRLRQVARTLLAGQ